MLAFREIMVPWTLLCGLRVPFLERQHQLPTSVVSGASTYFLLTLYIHIEVYIYIYIIWYSELHYLKCVASGKQYTAGCTAKVLRDLSTHRVKCKLLQ